MRWQPVKISESESKAVKIYLYLLLGVAILGIVLGLTKSAS